MLNYVKFREFVAAQLRFLGLHSEHAVGLLLAKCAHESVFGTYIRQVGGPALGVFQMEPFTENDCWVNFLDYKPPLAKLIKDLRDDERFHLKNQMGLFATPPKQMPITNSPLEVNLAYQVAMARVRYLRSPLPIGNTREAWADIWKAAYNTVKGKGTKEEFLAHCDKFLPDSMTA